MKRTDAATLPPPAGAAPLLLASACAGVRDYGAVAVERRRAMNDAQARATMAATCDVALGAYFRELSARERGYVGLVCGGMFPERAEASPEATAAERPELLPAPGGGHG